MVLDATLLNTQLYKVRTKGKVEQSRERCSALPYTSPTPSYYKGSLQVTLDNGHQLTWWKQEYHLTVKDIETHTFQYNFSIKY